MTTKLTPQPPRQPQKLTLPLQSVLPPRESASWVAARLSEARCVIADVARHSDHLVRIACQVLTIHSQSDRERRDARALLFAIEAKRPPHHKSAQRQDDGRARP